MSLKPRTIMPSHTYQAPDGVYWYIHKESLPKKRGIYNYWVGETADQRHGLRGDSMRELREKIDLYIPKINSNFDSKS